MFTLSTLDNVNNLTINVTLSSFHIYDAKSQKNFVIIGHNYSVCFLKFSLQL